MIQSDKRRLPPDSAIFIFTIILLGVICWLIIWYVLKYLMPESIIFLDSLLPTTFLIVLIFAIIAVIIAYATKKRK